MIRQLENRISIKFEKKNHRTEYGEKGRNLGQHWAEIQQPAKRLYAFESSTFANLNVNTFLKITPFRMTNLKKGSA